MRIAEIQATPVRVPVTRTGTMARAKRTHVLRTIVEVVTDDGTVGLALCAVLAEQPGVERPGDRRRAARARHADRWLTVPRRLYEELARRSRAGSG